MRKKLFIIILILLMVAIAYAADQKLTQLTELTAVADTDIIYIVDDPGGSPLSRKITVLNLFDTIDTFAELNTIVAGKTLVNEEDAVTWDALGTFNAGIISASSSVTPLVDLNPAHTGTATIVDITPSAVISTNEAVWNAVIINGAALDPSGDDVLVCGMGIDFSGVVPSGSGGDIDGIQVRMVDGEKHAVHIEEGKVVIDNTAGSAVGAEYTVVDIRLNTASLNTNSDIHAIDIAVEAGTPAGKVVAIGTHTNVNPIAQSIGTFSTPNQTEYAGERHTGGTVWVDGVDGSEIFVADDDAVYVGAAAVFNEIEVDMATAATKSVTPTFHYNTAADTWTQFFPADDTDGFQQDGTVRWDLDDISGSWTNDGDPCGAETSTGYWIKIVRTANADPGTPTPTTIKTGVIISCFWNKIGTIDVVSLEGDTITEGGQAVWNATETDILDSGHYIADSIDNEHINWADIDNLGDEGAVTLAATVTVSDDESTDDDQEIVFTTDNTTLESDGDFHYSPDTGTVTATQFAGGGAGVTSVDAITGDSATAFFDAGTIEHEYGGLETDISSYTGLVAITGGSTAEVDAKSELEGHIADVADFAEADGDTYSGVHDFTSVTTIVPWKVNATAAPTVEGQAIWESDTDELTVGDGSVSIVIGAKTNTVFAFNIHDIDAGMDDIKMPFTRAVTITKVTAFVTGGTNVVGRLYEVDSDGDDADAVGVESSDWTFTAGETEDTSFNNATFDAGDYIQWDTTSVSGSVTGFMISVEGYEI